MQVVITAWQPVGKSGSKQLWKTVDQKLHGKNEQGKCLTSAGFWSKQQCTHLP